MAKRKNAKVEEAAEAATITAYKGFDTHLQCRGYQFEIGKTYEHAGAVVACESGFHACEYPLNVFDYYAPTHSRYAEVTLAGATAEHDRDTKIAAAKITVNVELTIGMLVQRAVKWVFDRAIWSDGNNATGYQGAASATGYQGAASATGYQGAASATGIRSAASATGIRSAASATGIRSAASATGDQGAASATGKKSVALASGLAGRARGDTGCAIFLVRRDDNDTITHAFAGVVGRDNLKPMIWYTLDESGRPVECDGGE